MIQRAYEMFAQEPWTAFPWQWERLTDWQIENLYAKPAMERSEEMQKSLPSGSSGAGNPVCPTTTAPRTVRKAGPDFEPGTDGHRRQCISAFVNIQGLSKERAVKQYEHQLEQWRASQVKG